MLSSCGNNAEHGAKPESAPKSAAVAKAAPMPAAQKQYLTIETVAAAPGSEVLSLPGRVTFRPQANSAIGATVAGRVVAQLVRAGEVVKAGTPVLTIESADASAARIALDQSAARLAAAESLHRRIIETIEKGVGLEFERHESEAKVKEARAEHERARQAVALMGEGRGSLVIVRAPTNGVVMSIRVAVGATVAPGGEPLLELGDPSLLQVVAQVAESDMRRIVIGQDAEVEFPALSSSLVARVESISPRIDPESRRGQVFFAIAKRIDGLQAGMLAQIALKAGNDSAILLPVSAVLIKDGKRRVVYIERPDGTFEPRDVETGRNRNGSVLILKGLSAGDKVVVRGALLLDTQAELML